MNLWVGITDFDWFSLHASKDHVEEVNFWRPSARQGFRALQPGGMFLFKLRSKPFIAGGGFFAKYLPLPLSLAWDAFQEGNGARSLEELRRLIGRNRHESVGPTENPLIGCILLEEPFFFAPDQWIALPADFKPGIQQGKRYEMTSGTGLTLWQEVRVRLSALTQRRTETTKALSKCGTTHTSYPLPGPATLATIDPPRYGNPMLVAPRLGQGSFRALVTHAYGYECAITKGRALPVLEAAHIHSYKEGGTHDLANGVLFRSDLHTLFDRYYLSIHPARRTLEVSVRIKEEFDNGHEYYQMRGKSLAEPKDPVALPSRANLEYHFDKYCQLEA